MNTDIRSAMVWAGGLIVIALAATVARQQGWIEGEAVNRIVLGAIGLMVAWYGNRMPKAFAPNGHARRVARVGGWSMALSGLAYACLWAFAPPTVALVVGCGAILAGIAVTFAFCVLQRGRAQAA
ncbi:MULTISPECIES: ammonium transporter [unclassified Brevundimonas]|uniref:ammonium transporter n=1 Tax=unclassified Brevundimonas TaxID=2622653 RepID=UPI001ADEA162|nr:MULTISPECIES: ammonium transporter [unclassified Brevundimonas]